MRFIPSQVEGTSALFLFLLVGVALGARIFFALHQAPSPILQSAGRMAVVEGVVADDLDTRATAVRATIAVATVNGAPQLGKVLAVLPPSTALQYGDAGRAVDYIRRLLLECGFQVEESGDPLYANPPETPEVGGTALDIILPPA